VFHSLNEDRKIRRVRLFSKDLTTFYPDCIYIFDHLDTLKTFLLSHADIITFLVSEEKVKISHSNIILFITKLNKQNLLQLTVDLILSFNNWTESLMNSIMSKDSIKKFLDIASEKLNNPLALFDNSLTTLSNTDISGYDLNGTIWEFVISLGYVPNDFYTAKEHIFFSNNLNKKTSLPYVFVPSKDNKHEYVTSHIWIDGNLYGNLGSVAINGKFTAGQLSLINYIVDLIKLYFLNNSEVKFFAKNSSNFIIDLIHNKEVHESIIQHHLNRANIKNTDDLLLLALASDEYDTNPVNNEKLINKLTKVLLNPIYTFYDEKIIVLIKSDTLLKRSDMYDVFSRILVSSNFRCGVSSVFSDINLLHIKIKESLFSVEMSGNQDRKIVFYKDVFFERVIKEVSLNQRVRDFCYSKIIDVYHDSEGNGMDNIKLIYTLLLNGGNLTTTANKLFIHRNTLVYRINKLEERLEINLKNISDGFRFYILFTCKIILEGLYI